MILKNCVSKIKNIIKTMPGHIFDSKNNIIFMESLNGFDGNAGAIYDYMISNPRYNSYKFVWAVKNKSLFKHKKNKRTVIISSKKLTLKSVILNCRARYIMYDDTLMGKYGLKQTVIYLSHGCPSIKNVKGLIKVPQYVDYVLCTSEKMVDIMSYQFSADKNKMFICGLPRNDTLFKKSHDIEKLLNGKKYKKIILWLPTFRKSVYENRNDTTRVFELGIPLIYEQADFKKLNDYLNNKNVMMLIKLHPGQDLSVIKVNSMSNIMLLSDFELKNKNISLYSIMNQTDALLTDYSSVVFDYMLIDMPIGFIIDDMADYKLGFAFDNIEDIMAGCKIINTEDLKQFIDDLICGKDVYKNERHAILSMTNTYRDGNNCKRLLELFNL